MATTDFEVNPAPNDGVSGLAFSSQADILACSSWDNQIRIYQVQANGQTVPQAAYSHQGPALDVAWSKDGTKVVSCGADKAGRMYDVATGQSTQVAAHDDTIRSIRFLEQQPHVMVTGGWDKSLKYWDTRAPSSTPISTASLPERLYSMDTRQNLLVAATANRHVLVFDLNNPTVPYKQSFSPLRWQTRTVSCFTDGSGYALGSIEGRVAIQYIQDADKDRGFLFKSNREEGSNTIHSCNQVSFHPTNPATFTTCGSDGVVVFWNRELKRRNNALPKVNGTISNTCFNGTGTIFAYAVSYDWHQGAKLHNPNTPPRILLHPVSTNDLTPQPK
ncbi:WD40 repeat-like protein [Hesseltinella vesiculosa]|uniref:WD40 repeat-like protein n=1 Tax=Hesseltinella vesiculosa TaxID=101127 RepID=A0A1X2GAF9_9FUNG|nr:WD40 repeat-like protein [Hesseltinella vesiculosa]